MAVQQTLEPDDYGRIPSVSRNNLAAMVQALSIERVTSAIWD